MTSEVPAFGKNIPEKISCNIGKNVPTLHDGKNIPGKNIQGYCKKPAEGSKSRKKYPVVPIPHPVLLSLELNSVYIYLDSQTFRHVTRHGFGGLKPPK
jgi:hypothetical protein